MYIYSIELMMIIGNPLTRCDIYNKHRVSPAYGQVFPYVCHSQATANRFAVCAECLHTHTQTQYYIRTNHYHTVVLLVCMCEYINAQELRSPQCCSSKQRTGNCCQQIHQTRTHGAQTHTPATVVCRGCQAPHTHTRTHILYVTRHSAGHVCFGE